jgi:predicted transcriptional regulator
MYKYKIMRVSDSYVVTIKGENGETDTKMTFMTTNEAAKFLKVSRFTIRNYATGKRKTTKYIVEKRKMKLGKMLMPA